MNPEKSTTILQDSELKLELQRRAVDAGFLQARVAGATAGEANREPLEQWLAGGMHGEMEYMARHPRHNAEVVLPGAKAVIVFAASYFADDPDLYDAEEMDPAQEIGLIGPMGPIGPMEEGLTVRVARYARGKDYHLVLREKLAPVVEWLREVRPGHEWRICVDSAPLLERAFAEQSGIGFVGKNTMLISQGAGSYYFLAEVVTTAEIAPDAPVLGTCGTCTRCIDACPTEAIVAPYKLDARRCISYLTIERKSELSENEAARIGDWAFGCDICQDVCPYNKRPAVASIEEFSNPRVGPREPLATFIEPDSNSQFAKRFADSPVLRPGRKRVQANARAAAENQSGAAVLPLVESKLKLAN